MLETSTRESSLPADGDGHSEKRPGPEDQPQHDSGVGVVEAVMDKARSLGAAAGDLAGQATEKAQEWASTAVERTADAAVAAGHFAVEAKDTAQQWTSTAMHKTGDALQVVGRDLTTLVRRYPVPAVCVGLALGFVLGACSRRLFTSAAKKSAV